MWLELWLRKDFWLRIARNWGQSGCYQEDWRSGPGRGLRGGTFPVAECQRLLHFIDKKREEQTPCSNFLYLYLWVCVWLCVCEHAREHACVWGVCACVSVYTCGSQGQLMSLFSLSTAWSPGTELLLSSLAASVFIHWAISLVQEHVLSGSWKLLHYQAEWKRQAEVKPGAESFTTHSYSRGSWNSWA